MICDMIDARASACTFAAALFAAVLSTLPAHAEPYPARSVRIIVPNEPGGIYDLVARLMATELSNRLPQRFYVENKPGAGSILGTQAAAMAVPDGYTLLMGGLSNMVFNAALYRKLSYDPLRDFVPVTFINKFAYLLVARADLPYSSLSEIVEAVRLKPNALTLAHPGLGSAPQIVGAALMKVSGTQLVEVPYKGVQAPLTDMLAGGIDLMFISQSAATPYIREGRVKAIATSDVRRSAALPDVPTLLAAGANVSLEAWLGLFAPAQTPNDALDTLRTQTRAALPAMRDRLEAGASEVMEMPQAATDEYLRQQYDFWTDTIRKIGLRLD